MFILAASVVLIHVTAPDGAKVHINPAFITKMYPTKEALDKGPNQMVVKGAKCVITMADTKFISVIEPCDYVLRLIDEADKPRGRR